MLKPYYENTQLNITLYQGDCLELLPCLPAESVHLVFADPPFNVGKPYAETNDRRKDYYPWCEKWIDECFRILAPTGSLYVMTLARHLPDLLPMLHRRGVFIHQVVWRNVSANRSPRAFWNSYQAILVYGKSGEYRFNPYAQLRPMARRNLRWGKPGLERKARLFDYWDDIPFVYAGSVHHKEAILQQGTNKKAHPCQMPIDLAARAIEFSSNPGDTILDPFAGSGSTLIAAARLKRRAVGIEISKTYCDLIVHRLETLCATELLAPERDGSLIHATSSIPEYSVTKSELQNSIETCK